MTSAFSLVEARQRYDEALSHRLKAETGRMEKPVIGITTNLGEFGAQLAIGYYDSIRQAGGVPLLLAPTNDPQELLAQIEQLDGILLSGGGDLNPLWLGQQPWPELHSICPERDLYELELCRLSHQRNIPVMGICRGCQVMAAALGGEVAQDIEQYIQRNGTPSALPSDTTLAPLLKHSQSAPRSEATHLVKVCAEDCLLSTIGVSFAVNSFHHQAVAAHGPLMRVTAMSEDGVIEAIESLPFESFLLGVQWHPECLAPNETSRQLFGLFVQAADSYRRALELHARVSTLDSHCDTPMMFEAMMEAAKANGESVDPATWIPDLWHRNPHCLVDMVKASEGRLDETYMVSYIPQGPRTEDGYQTAREQVELTRRRLDSVLLQEDAPLYIHFGIENGYAIGKDLSLLAHYQNLGVEYITLCHNGHNDICDSARPRKDEPLEEWNGLSPFGREVVCEMNRLGLLIDLSHAAEKTFYDVLALSTKPVAVTHACCRALCDHPRNLTDDQLRAIAAKDGVVQCTMYAGFLRSEGQATLNDFMQHLVHMIEVAGVEHVGIGSDFDGDGGVPGLRDASDMIHITQRLIDLGFDDNEICCLWGDNFRRVMAAQKH